MLRRGNPKVSSWALVGAGAVAIGHYARADSAAGPRIFTDEVGYLAVARYLSGGGSTDLRNTPFRSAGFPALLVPLSRAFSQDPGRLYASVIVGQALLAAASMLLIAQLCRWLFGTSAGLSILVALTACLYPAFVTDTGFAWSETALTVALLVALTSVFWVLRGVSEAGSRGRLEWRAIIAGSACGFLVTVHGRMLLAALVLVLIAISFLLRHRARRAAAGLTGAFALTFGAGELLNRHLRDALWAGQVRGKDLSSELGSARHLSEVTSAGLKLAGQYWYQVVGSVGLVAIGLVGLVVLAWGRLERPSEDSSSEDTSSDWRRVAAAAVVAVFASLLVVSAAFLADASARGDYFVYGRYVDVVTPLVVALAIAWLGSSPSVRALACAAAALLTSLGATLIVLEWTGKTESARGFSLLDIFAILGWLEYPRHNPALFRATAWTALIGFGAIAIVLTKRAGPGPTWKTATVCVAVAGVFVWQLSFVGPKVLTPLGRGAEKTQEVVKAVRATRVKEVRVEPTIARLALALGYWLPGVSVRNATPALDRCWSGLRIAQSPRAAANQVRIARAGTFFVFRQTADCRR